MRVHIKPLLLLTLVLCTGCPPPPPADDGGTPSPAVDAGGDDDAGADAGSADAGAPPAADAGQDAGPTPSVDSGTDADGGGGGDAGPDVPDAGRTDAGHLDAGHLDAGQLDAGPPVVVDAGPPVCTTPCEGFTECVADDTCASMPTCGAADACDDGRTCSAGFCVPDDVDVDGDGVPAAADCDEDNTAVHEGAVELCNGQDEDCDDEVDESNGHVDELCANDAFGDVCSDGSCACAPTEEAETAGLCADAADLGNIPDTGASLVREVTFVEGDVWFRFRGVDTSDAASACDNYHVRVRFLDGSDDYAFDVHRGGCGAPVEVSGVSGLGYVVHAAGADYKWAADFRQTIDGTVTGQCPCYVGPDNNRPAGQDHCADDSADYFVRVYRRDSTNPTCTSATLEFSNGVYDT